VVTDGVHGDAVIALGELNDAVDTNVLLLTLLVLLLLCLLIKDGVAFLIKLRLRTLRLQW
jgi:hypothetical protein